MRLLLAVGTMVIIIGLAVTVVLGVAGIEPFAVEPLVGSTNGYFEVTSYPSKVDLGTTYLITVSRASTPHFPSPYISVGVLTSTDDPTIEIPEDRGIASCSVVIVQDGETKSFSVTTTTDPSYYGRTVFWKVVMMKASGWGPPWVLEIVDEVYLPVEFHNEDFTLTTSINPPSGGTVSPSGGTYGAGSSVPIVATPASGYEFSFWSGDASGSENPLIFTMNSDKNIIANFLPRVYYTLAVYTATGEGTVSGAGTYESGTEVEVEATPAVGYIFEKWGGDISGTTNPTTITMTGNKNVFAYFIEGTYTLTMSVSPSGSGTTSPSAGTHTYDAGSFVTISATPASGHSFSLWSGSETGTENPKTIIIDVNKTITAIFDKVSIPEADFSYSPVNPEMGETVYFADDSGVYFVADGSRDPSKHITAWSWNFGLDAQPFTSTSQNPACVYTSSGSKTVTLTVTANDGTMDEVSKTLTVTYVPPLLMYKLSGYVLDDDTNDEIAGASITVGLLSDTSDGNGYYEVTGLLSGTYPVRVSKEGYVDSTYEVTISEADETLVVKMKAEKEPINLNFVIGGMATALLGVAIVFIDRRKARWD